MHRSTINTIAQGARETPLTFSLHDLPLDLSVDLDEGVLDLSLCQHEVIRFSLRHVHAVVGIAVVRYLGPFHLAQEGVVPLSVLILYLTVSEHERGPM